MFVSAMFVSALLGTAASAIPAAASAVDARTAMLTPAEMFGLADAAEAGGDLRTAATIYSALEGNPDSDIRAEAKFRHAKQLLEQNRNRDAALLLRRLVDERPDARLARLELAHVLQLLGDTEGAWRQVRAVQATGLPPSVARLVDRYSEALRAARPQGGSFEISLAPDSNINHATRSDTLGTILGDFDIDKNSQAKSGTGLSLQGQAYRRLALGSGDNSLLVRATALADLYGRAKFNDIALDVAGGPELRLGGNQINVEVGATQRWYGQKPFMRSARLGVSWIRPLGSRTQVQLTGVAALVDNRFNHLEGGRTYSGRIDLERALSSTTGMALSLSLNREGLRDPGYSTWSWRAGVLGWHDVGRMTFTAEANFGSLNADERLVLFPDKRSDRYSRFSIGATFRQFQFRGFAPVARFSIERNRSTVEFYDYRRMRSEMGVVRAF